MQNEVFINFNGNTFLSYRETDKVGCFVSLMSGSIETHQLTINEMRRMRLTRYDKCTPEHFAKVYLSSHLPITPQARAILRPLVGLFEDSREDFGGQKFSGGTVSLHEICEIHSWDPKQVRKQLRKLMDKPGGRWEWDPDEAQKVIAMVKECLPPETTN